MSQLPIQIEDWGRTAYEAAFERQLLCLKERIQGSRGDTLIFTEHDPVYTLGKRKDAIQHLLWDESTLAANGVTLSQSNRGGDITYHGPGQIVGYAIVSLTNKRDLHAYLRDLENVIIQALAHYKLQGTRVPGKTGIWLEDRKIAAIGVAVKQWVTYHGFAFNINNDLFPFSGIIPCGIASTEGSVTSLSKELGHDIDLLEVKNAITEAFQAVFKAYS